MIFLVKESVAMRPSTEIDTLRQQLPYHRLRKTQKAKVLPIDWPTEWERFDANELFAFDMATIPQSCWRICANGRTS